MHSSYLELDSLDPHLQNSMMKKTSMHHLSEKGKIKLILKGNQNNFFWKIKKEYMHLLKLAQNQFFFYSLFVPERGQI